MVLVSRPFRSSAPGNDRGRWISPAASRASLSVARLVLLRPHGILLISPYPATREVLREMDDAGGLGHWKPAIPPEGDLEREAWLWLAASREGRPPVHCYFASGDRFAPGQRRMAQTLAPGRVRELPGGHDWKAWSALWRLFLCDSKAALQ